MDKNKIFGGIFGLIVGDALGVPVEFVSREELKENPVKDMIGYGTYNMPPGTWSDDSSLTLCLLDSLCNGLNLNDMADKFIKWYKDGLWTPFGDAFDIGNTTKFAINNLIKGVAPDKAGPIDERSNGNGSLMRILPIAFYLKDFDISEQFNITHKISAITHGHMRSQIACGIYIQFIIQLLEGKGAFEAYDNTKKIALDFYSKEPFNTQLSHYNRILKSDISKLEEHEISSSGYVVSSLEASFWCFFNSSNFEECVLKAVNLGYDTDTIGAIAGGIAGVYYGFDSIPEKWVKNLIRFEDISELAELFYNSLL